MWREVEVCVFACRLPSMCRMNALCVLNRSLCEHISASLYECVSACGQLVLLLPDPVSVEVYITGPVCQAEIVTWHLITSCWMSVCLCPRLCVCKCLFFQLIQLSMRVRSVCLPATSCYRQTLVHSVSLTARFHPRSKPNDWWRQQKATWFTHLRRDAKG